MSTTPPVAGPGALDPWVLARIAFVAITVVFATAPSVSAQCAEGRVTTPEGLCCWPGQTWSPEEHVCIGAPTCPAPLAASGEQCVAPVLVLAPTVAPIGEAALAPSPRLTRAEQFRRTQTVHGVSAVLSAWVTTAVFGPIVLAAEGRATGPHWGWIEVPLLGPIVAPIAVELTGGDASALLWSIGIGSTVIQLASWIVLIDALTRDFRPSERVSLRPDGVAVTF